MDCLSSTEPGQDNLGLDRSPELRRLVCLRCSTRCPRLQGDLDDDDDSRDDGDYDGKHFIVTNYPSTS